MDNRILVSMPFAILKYSIKALGQEAVVWEKVGNPLADGQKFLTPKQARKLIADYEMEEVHRYKDGIIWDTPNRDWTKRYRGTYAKLREEKRLAYKMKLLKQMNKK